MIFYRLILSVLVLLTVTFSAWAQLNIDITEGNLNPVPIAVTDPESDRLEGRETGAQIAQVIRANLDRSGLFKSLAPEVFQSSETSINYKPVFTDWRVIRAEALLVSRVVVESSTRIRYEARLWDVTSGEQLTGVVVAGTPSQWRRIAHKISDQVYENLTGETGYFDSRIVYVAESGPKTNRVKKLAIMDQDGANAKILQSRADLVLTPRFSPSIGQDETRNNDPKLVIAYMSYEKRIPQVYLYDIHTGNRELLGNFPGMTFAPRFAPDGRSLVMSMMEKGNSDLYLMDMTSRSTKRLTTSPAIDVSGSFSPDGKNIVFNSNRGGSRQLYVMPTSGGNAKRISFGKGQYSAPVWSPRGDKIAFVKSLPGKFGIGVMNVDGSGERILTESFLDESPTWSPNGRVIIFSRESRGTNGKSALWSVDLTGRNLRKVPTNGAASDPAWSPLLP